jgi:hypothetical protein
VNAVKLKALEPTIFLILLLSTAAGAFFIKSAQANPYFRNVEYTEVSPPAGTKPPIITIHTPQNGSHYPKNLTLTFDVATPEPNGNKSIYAITEVYYRGSWNRHEITITQKAIHDSASFSIDLSDVRGGNHSVTIYAVGYGSYKIGEEFDSESYTMTYYIETFEITGFSMVHFTKDVVSPRITFQSPPNGTYVASDVELDFTVSEADSEILYSLDGKQNQTITESLTLTGLTEGTHNVTMYAVDLAGNAAEPKTLFFNVDLPVTFPVAPVAAVSGASVAIFGAGLRVYLKKRER